LEKWSSGVKRITDLFREQHIPDPRFHLGKGTVCLTFKKAQKNSDDLKGDLKDVLKELTERQLLILNLIVQDPSISAKEMSEKVSEKMSEKMSEKEEANVRTIERDIAQLKKRGILIREGGRKQGYWVILSDTQSTQ
jgi:predicted HTH transcriptional regulator